MARKPKRRKPNTGTIRYKAGRDRPWEAAFPIGPGKWRYDSFTTWPEATAYLDRLTAERDSADAPRDVIGGSQLVKVFLTAWLNLKAPHIKPKTLSSYRYLCNLAIAHIGMLRVDEMTRQRGDALIAYFHRNKFQNVSQMRAVLRQAFQYAEDEEYIRRNPFTRVKAPPVERRPGIALTTEQRAQMLEAAAVEDTPDVPLCPLWHLYARLGLRRGEGIGLRRADIDFQKGTISVVQQYTDLDGRTVLSTPKSKRARRTLPAPDDVLDLLRAQLADQARRAAADPDWRISGLVFVDGHGGRLTVSHVWYRWRLLRQRAGIPEQVTIHDLRRTALTILELGGTPRNVVQAIAGHSSSTQTGLYTDHAGLEDMRRALGS